MGRWWRRPVLDREAFLRVVRSAGQRFPPCPEWLVAAMAKEWRALPNLIVHWEYGQALRLQNTPGVLKRGTWFPVSDESMLLLQHPERSWQLSKLTNRAVLA